MSFPNPGPDWATIVHEAAIHTVMCAAALLGGYLLGAVVGSLALSLAKLVGWPL